MVNKSESAGGRHAIVVGASIAGLTTARILSKHFDQVTLIERDELPYGPELRPGVPQAFHGHALLARGHRELEKLFPGLDAELDAAGAVAGDALADTAILHRVGWLPRFASGVTSRACSRSLLEFCIRRRVLALPGVRLLQRRQVTGLLWDQARRRVIGVSATSLDESSNKHELHRSNFVVDASGCTSRACQWLVDAGFPKPRTTVVNTQVGYATRRFEQPADSSRDWKVLLVFGSPPDFCRSGVIYPEEGNRWVVGLGGGRGDYPPTDEAGFLEFARSLRTPRLYEAIRHALPLTPIRGYRRMENRLHHFDKVSPWPEGFAVIGDAVCAFNPYYAEGVMVSVLSALALEACLRTQRGRDKTELRGLGRRFQKRLAGVLATPWMFATLEDARYCDQVSRGLLARLTHWYMDEAMRDLAGAPAVAKLFAEVLNFVEPPWKLMHPRIVARVLRHTLSGLLVRERVEIMGSGGIVEAGVVDAASQ